jgi:integrating conjugative element protein (TIGR03746 family)|tara:strand:+ start:40916 stop:41551 length:636 start_codon:yes stop_codon:yes gene_type:complete
VSDFNNLVHAKNHTIKLMGMGLVALGILLALTVVGWMRAPSQITLHYPPDLSAGATQGVGDIPKANLYSFAFYIFQQLNRWPNDGREDYFQRIHNLQNYLTPACFEDRLADFEYRDDNNELAGRSRAVWEIPGRGFKFGRVKATSDKSWVVGLDLHVQETLRGERVKDRLIHFPINVVSYSVDPQLNPWGLAIDCYASAPRAIEIDKEEEG